MPLENIKPKKVYIELDKQREIKFNMNALATLEQSYGSFKKAMEALQDSSIVAMRALLHAGLRHEDKSLTVDQVGELVDMGNIGDVTGKIMEAFQSALPAQSDLADLSGDSNKNTYTGDAPKN